MCWGEGVGESFGAESSIAPHYGMLMFPSWYEGTASAEGRGQKGNYHLSCIYYMSLHILVPNTACTILR